MSIMHRDRRTVKPTRRTDLPTDHRFGVGILRSLPPTAPVDHEYTDESWFVAEFSGSEGWNPDDLADLEDRAQQAAWEDRYDQMVAASNVCAVCGERTSELTGGLCDACNGFLDLEPAEIEGDELDAPDSDPAVRFAGIASLAERRKA